jgi:pimeloyl-ACP methyl ester carboxylesterase
LPAAQDGRARFREIFCQLAAPGGEQLYDATNCDGLLWRLADEPSPSTHAAVLPGLASHLRIFVVSGAFGDCRDLDTIPYGDEIKHLSSQGNRIQAVMVSGRSSAERNARQLAAAIGASGLEAGDRIVLIGYSKGAVDILQFLSDYPQLARQVVAVVSIAGAIRGSPLAGKADWWYRSLFTRSFSGMCDPGDGGVIESLLPERRRQWLAEHPLPAHVAYFSLAAFPTGEHLSRGLSVPWRILADDDRRNDGQVLIEDAVIPGSTLLGYVNADHWDVAISIDLQMPHLSARKSPRQFPRPALLDATLLYVSESLESHARHLP